MWKAKMATAVSALLEQRLVKAKENLEDVEESLRKLTGGDRVERRVSVGDTRRLVIGDQRRVSGDQRRQSGDQRTVSSDLRRISVDASPGWGGGRGLTVQRLNVMERLGAPLAKKPGLGSPFSRLGNRVGPRRRAPSDEEDEDQDVKPVVQSSVVATPTLTRTRQQSIKEQQKDKTSIDRNKRMFGHLLGTLQKFRDENEERTDKEKRRKEIEKKLEVKAVEEKKAAVEEKRQLLQERRDKQAELDRLEQLVELTQENKEWDAHTQQLMGFIRTKARPHILYKPARWTLGTEKLLKETKQHFNATIERRRVDLEKRVAELEGKKKQEKKEDAEEDSKKERRRSRDDKRRRHSGHDEVKGKKDDKEGSRREDSSRQEKEEKRRSRKRSRHEDEKETSEKKGDKREKMSSAEGENVKENGSAKDRTEQETVDADTVEERSEDKGDDGKVEGKYEGGEEMGEKKMGQDGEERMETETGGGDKVEVESDQVGEERGTSMVQDVASGEGEKMEGEVPGLADDAWGAVGWGDEEESKANAASTLMGQIDDTQNEQEQLDYIYDDL